MQLIRCLLSNFLFQHVLGIIMPIIRRIRPCPAACGVLSGCVGCGWLWSCGLILLMMGIMMPKTCWDRKFDNKHRISCILLVLSLHLVFTMHGHKNLKPTEHVSADGILHSELLTIWTSTMVCFFLTTKQHTNSKHRLVYKKINPTQQHTFSR